MRKRARLESLATQSFSRVVVALACVCSLVAPSSSGFVASAQSEGGRKAATTTARRVEIAPDLKSALERISADSLRGHLSFIASDALEGRDTPSRGLEIAAEYVAAQFRRAGLEAVGDEGYFQTASWLTRGRTLEGFELKFHTPRGDFAVGREAVSLSFDVQGRAHWSADEALTLARAPIVKIALKDAATLTPEQIKEKVILTELPDFRRGADRASWREPRDAQTAFLNRLAALGASLVIVVDRDGAKARGAGAGRMIDPESRDGASPPSRAASLKLAVIGVHGAEAVGFYDALKPGATDASASLRLSAPIERPLKLRNVVGLLRGSDPALKDTYVLLTAHYDHVGVEPDSEDAGDRIYNGANDDGSGTVSVIEIASALAKLKMRPKRSIVFMTYFGEEKGLRGSRFYGRHPLFPIEKTVANVNLEQVGRTDDVEGPEVMSASLTGFDYSDMGETFRAAGAGLGVRVHKHPRNSDAFFSRSDNQALADMGVPAHTVSVGYMFPDYHAVGDHWEKIDYPNMEHINRMIAAGVFLIADDTREPRWNESNPKAEKYLKAWRARRGK